MYELATRGNNIKKRDSRLSLVRDFLFMDIAIVVCDKRVKKSSSFISG